MRISLLALALLLACRCKGDQKVAGGPPTPPPPPPGDSLEPLAWPEERIDWLAVGTGGAPVDTQVQIEQDVALVQSVLGGTGVTLFAGGPEAVAVQVVDDETRPDQVLQRLGDLFSPRGGRNSRYRRPDVRAHGPATRELFLRTLREELATPGPTLTVYFAGHGLQGEEPRKNLIVFWGQDDLLVEELAAVLEEGQQRPLRLVMTSCYGGGFAELAFDASGEASGAEVCGFFASPWDLPAAGCDPNPDRASQEGYGLYFLQALAGRDREGSPLASVDIDADESGTISYLEAHNYARHASRSANVPVSMSERFLQQHAESLQAVDPAADHPTPHLDHVIDGLAARLKVRDPEAEQERLLQDLQSVEAAATELAERITLAEEDEAEAFRRASAEVLGAFPYLDDPWHPHYRRLLSTQMDAIRSLLATSPEVAEYERAVEAIVELDGSLWELRDQTAPLESLVRALQARDLVRRLAARGGADWERYQRFRACELEEPALKDSE